MPSKLSYQELEQRVLRFETESIHYLQIQKVLETRLELMKFAQSRSIDEILRQTLDEVERLTGSLVSFYHFVEPDKKTLLLQMWSTRTASEFCRADGTISHYSIDKAGVWVDCVRQRQAVIHNDYSSLKHRKGLPEGHAPITRELVVPIFRNDCIVAILGVGNKEQDYDDGDLEVVTKLADLAWDIVERKQEEEKLHRNEKILNITQKLTKIGGWQWNIENEDMFWTDETYRIHGLDPASITPGSTAHISKSLECYCPQDRQILLQAFEICKNEGIPYDLTFQFTAFDGTQKWIRTTAEAVVKNGNIYEITGNIRDITDRKKAKAESVNLNERLQQAQKMEAIGNLAGGIAHDFNNILAAIIGYAEMAREDVPPDSTVAKDLDQVLEGGNRAKDLVQQILAFSRQNEMEYIPLQPVSVLNEVIKILRPSLPTTIEINQDIASTTGQILADPTQIHQVLMNLCTNAFHAMEETGGELDISLKEVTLSPDDLVHEPNVEPGIFVQLSISDSGPGIAPEIKKKIFEPYFTTKEIGKGTGMGLAIVHGIVKSNGGFISIYSEPEKGTAFHVFLPVIEKELQPEIEDVEPIPVGVGRILFVDDEEILAKMGKSMLERLGYHVTVRNSSLEALETFQNQPDQFDLVITDQTMPGMTGSELSRRILQISPGIPIILCTGYSTIISEEKAKSIGIKEFALKPLSKKDIAVLIRKVLNNIRS